MRENTRQREEVQSGSKEGHCSGFTVCTNRCPWRGERKLTGASSQGKDSQRILKASIRQKS